MAAREVDEGVHRLQRGVAVGGEAGEQDPVQFGRVPADLLAGCGELLALLAEGLDRLLRGALLVQLRVAGGHPRLPVPGGEPQTARAGRGDREGQPGRCTQPGMLRASTAE